MANQIPQVPRIKTIRNVFQFINNPIPLINETIKEMGSQTYRVHLGGINRSIMTQDPEIIQHVLQKNHKNYYKSKLQTKSLAKYAGYGLLTTDGDYWLKQRRLIQPGFHKKKLKSLVATMDQVIKDHVNRIRQDIQSGNSEIELTKDMVNLTLKIVSTSLFGSGMSEEDLAIIGESVITAQIAVIKNVRQPFFKWWRMLNGEEKHYSKAIDNSRILLNKLVEDRRKSKDTHDDLLDMLLHSTYEDTGEGMTNKQILAEILIIFAAGHETTANALTWSLYLLDQHPDIKDKLLKEINAVDLPENPGFEHIAQLGYTRQVISEAMRIYPPAWITDRVALEDDKINGVKINKGELVGIFIYGAHHSKELWENPSTFDPERFSPENKKNIPAYAYFPFGGGPRLCIGQQFAWTEMILAMYLLLKAFNFKLAKDQQIDVEPLITLRPKYGMRMNVSIRN
jgi:cytochrome P450